MQDKTKLKNVLVTGVSSGLGQSVARQLREKNYYVIATGRNAEQAALLKAEHCCDTTILVDLGDAASVQTVPGQLREQGIEELAGFLHCAAVTGGAPIETMTMDQARSIFEVNVFGFLALMQATIEFLRQAQGRMVLTGSIAGFSVWPMLGVYGATKHAMEAIVDAARRELWPWGIKVSLIRPGGIKTRMIKLHLEQMEARMAALEGPEKENYLGLYTSYCKTLASGDRLSATPDYMAEKIIKVFESTKPKPDYCVGTDAKLLRFIDLVFPDSVVDFITRKMFPVG